MWKKKLWKKNQAVQEECTDIPVEAFMELYRKPALHHANNSGEKWGRKLITHNLKTGKVLFVRPVNLERRITSCRNSGFITGLQLLLSKLLNTVTHTKIYK